MTDDDDPPDLNEEISAIQFTSTDGPSALDAQTSTVPLRKSTGLK